MSEGKWRGIVKTGWHPEKDGASLRGQVNGLLGRGDKSTSHVSSSHISRPLTELRDPASFGAPPKRTTGFSSPTSAIHNTSNSPISSSRTPTGGNQHHPQQQEGVAAAIPAPPKTWKIDTTGLSTAHLPPPPGRKDGADGRTPPVQPPQAQTHQPVPGRGPPPSLPPRLPPRSGSASPARISSPNGSPNRPAPHSNLINQDAVSRLGASGISVPGLGIGKPATTPSTPPPPYTAGRTTANSQTQQFGSDRRTDIVGSSVVASSQSTSAVANDLASVLEKKKKPPAPPPKKPGLAQTSGPGSQPPPPVPTATRPQF
ncbi:hypothetical protein BX600DRAFT_509134 [Xylariales sp. PMI_506]|nr:hypothetical protein BX600DRAFT_509134 [Xylariales sp. PMI_506]